MLNLSEFLLKEITQNALKKALSSMKGLVTDNKNLGAEQLQKTMASTFTVVSNIITAEHGVCIER